MVKLLKVHGSGNDFFLLDQMEAQIQLTEDQLKKMAQSVCDRKKGLHGGADGLLLVLKSAHQNVVARMRVINADGSEASMCGNGLRTVARYVATKEKLSPQNSFKIETMYADLQVKAAANLASGVPAYEVEISPVSFADSKIGMHVGQATLQNSVVPALSDSLKFSAVAVPNPHLISFVDKQTLKSDQLVKMATYLNSENPYFPDGVNVSFVQKISSNEIFVKTFERGVGLTNACGTAMSASSLIYVLQQLGQAGLEQTLKVLNPGGMVQTIVHQRLDGSYWISLIGNATVTASVSLDAKEAMLGNFSQAKWYETGEQLAYENFVNSLQK